MRVLYSADALGRSLLSGQAQVEELAGLAQGQKESLSRPRTSTNDESGPSSSLISRPNREIASERFRTRRRENDADREVDGFLAQGTTPVDLPMIVTGISGTSDTISNHHKTLLVRIDKFFRDRDRLSAEYGLSPEQIKHTSLSDLGIQPEHVLAQSQTTYHGKDHFWETLHDLRCDCGQLKHRLQLMDQVKYNLLNDPTWYRYCDSGNELGDANVLVNSLEPSVDASDMALSLSDLPVTLDVKIWQDRVNMSWLHDPYCACQRPEHRAQLRREWGDARKAIKAREVQENLEEHLRGHMHVARLEGYIRDDMLGPQDPSQITSKSRDPAVARVGMISSHTGSAASSEVVEENPFTEYPSTDSSGTQGVQDYQLQLMQLEQNNKKRLLEARQKHDTRVYDPLSKLFPDYAGLPPESRAMPFDVLVNRYQDAVAAASFSLKPFHFAPISRDAFDIPSLLRDHQRQQDAYLRSKSEVTTENTPEARARGRRRYVCRKIQDPTVHAIRNFWARETPFTANVEQAKLDSPLAMTRRFKSTYSARFKEQVLRERAAIQQEFDRERLAAHTTGISNAASAIQSARPTPEYHTMKQIENRLKAFEKKRAANQPFNEYDLAREARLQARLERTQAELLPMARARAQAIPYVQGTHRAGEATHSSGGAEEQSEQSCMSMHDATQTASNQWSSTQTREMNSQLHTQHTTTQASDISSTQSVQIDSEQAQQSAPSSPQHKIIHHPPINPQYPNHRPSAQPSDQDEDIQMEDFHCPYPACHDLLASGEAALRVEKEGRSEIWCAHEGCLQSFASKQRWGRHICTPHHDLVGLMRGVEE
ncbi:hypothetical protein MBLNU457_g0824t1 [Dothideomycetes sp. NU457]